MSNEDVIAEAIAYIKCHKKELLDEYIVQKGYVSVSNPFTIFMAGSPGAGKTEFSYGLQEEHTKLDPESKPICIDVDEVRRFIPSYDGHNSDLIQRAASLGVEKLFDYVQDHKINAIIDGTFANYEIAKKDILRALNKSRKVGIMYLYQDPYLAWEFTKKREKIEGRTVPKETFINAFYNAKENVNNAKKEFGKKIELHLVVKNYENKVQDTMFNIQEVDPYIKITYNKKKLEEILC